MRRCESVANCGKKQVLCVAVLTSDHLLQTIKVMKNQGYIDRRKVTWIRRNPRLFIGITSTVSLLALFSKPIYDIFISDTPLPNLNEDLKHFKSRIHRD